MSKYEAVRSMFRGRAARVLTVLALVGAIAVPSTMAALSATGDQEVHFKSGAPCAVFDTRFWDMDGDDTTDGQLGPVGGDNNEATFLIAGSDGSTTADWTFYDQAETTETTEAHQGADQSGVDGDENPDGCNVPDGADGVLLNLEAINPTGDGNIQVRPAGATEWGGVLIYDSSNFGVSNMLMLEINPTDDLQGHLEIKNNSGSSSVDVRGSVLGYTCDSGTC